MTLVTNAGSTSSQALLPVIEGTASWEILVGTDGAEVINGLDGSDVLVGQGGDDQLNGGEGWDWLSGGLGADTLDGGSGTDLLDGGAGDDVLRGGTGSDLYVVDSAGDLVEEAAWAGYDVVLATASFTLGANVEALVLRGTGAIDATGNAMANMLIGNNYANRLDGREGGDNLHGYNGADELFGGAGADILQGGGGDDLIVGGIGNDQIRGGSGADRFVVLQESVDGALETDTIRDFYASQGDRIDLAAIDAHPFAAGDQAFSLVGAFSGAAGEMALTWIASQRVTLLRLDVDGDGAADYQMRINGDVTGASSDWSF